MPVPLWVGPALGALGALGGATVNAVSQGNTNKESREWNEKMYALQRQHSLQDWAMMNEYNHPSQQMARLRESGLNPNLVYGKGADTQATPVQRSAPQAWNPRAPQFDVGSVIGAYFNTEQQQAQIDNLRTQNTIAVQDAILRAVSTLAGVEKTKADTEKTTLETGIAKELRDTTLEVAKVGLTKLKADTDVRLTEAEIAIASKAPNMEKAFRELMILHAQESLLQAQAGNVYTNTRKQEGEMREIEKRIQNLSRDLQLKDLDINLKQMGINPGDPMYIRILGQLFQKGLKSLNVEGIK